jgi:hypothetical protein
MFLGNYNKKQLEKKLMELDASIDYWIEMLFEKCVRMFTWKGLPESIPQKEIEIRLISEGYCGFVRDAKRGLMVASGGMSGPTQYYDEFTSFTYAAATAAGGTYKIGRDCCIIDNTTLRNPLMPLIIRYADLLAHADISLKMALVNTRITDTYAAEDESTAASINEYYEKIYKGKNGNILDKSMIEGVKNIAGSRSISAVSECIEARNEILRSFFAEIGVIYSKDKKERMIESEVNSDNQMLLLNVNDMKRRRQAAAPIIIRLFDLNVSVELSEEFEIIENTESEVSEDESKEADPGSNE